MDAVKPTALALVVVVASCVASEADRPANESQSQWNSLVRAVEVGQVESMDVFRIPPDVLRSVAVSPVDLEAQFQQRLTVRQLRFGRNRTGFVKAVKSVSLEPLDRRPDLRLGVVLYDSHGKRVEAVFLDKFGTRGVIGDRPVLIKGDLAGWVEGCFGRSIE
jgi:hypothetical protein